MQRSIDHRLAAERESKLLIGVAAGLGCVLVLCLVIAAIVVLLALLWTIQGQLGPGGGSLAPVLLALTGRAG